MSISEQISPSHIKWWSKALLLGYLCLMLVLNVSLFLQQRDLYVQEKGSNS